MPEEKDLKNFSILYIVIKSLTVVVKSQSRNRKLLCNGTHFREKKNFLGIPSKFAVPWLGDFFETARYSGECFAPIRVLVNHRSALSGLSLKGTVGSCSATEGVSLKIDYSIKYAIQTHIWNPDSDSATSKCNSKLQNEAVSHNQKHDFRKFPVPGICQCSGNMS